MDTYKGLEQPTYEVLPISSKRDSYELRHYFKSKWTSTEITSSTYEEGTSQGFRKLFNYIQGQNSLNTNVSMTVPVVTSIQNTADKAHFSGLKMIKSFYLPSCHHSKPPAPTREDVFTEEKSDIYVYVRRFGGHAKGKDFSHHAEILRTELQQDGVSNLLSVPMFYAVAYDNPRSNGERRNEVWISCSAP